MPRRLFGALVLTLFAPLAAPAQVPAPVKFDADITYRKLDGGKELKLDVAYPDGKGPYPAVVCVHGGAWRFGSRKEMSRWAKALAADGYVAAAISYRLVPDAKWPEPLEDCKTAVRFLRANAEKFRIDPERVGALGFSAGGHLVCMMGLAGKDAGFEGKEYADQSSRVCAVVSYFGPTDFAAFADDQTAQNSTFGPLVGASYKEKPEAHQKASPVSYVSKDAPPFLFVHGTKDWLVPIDQSRLMCKKLKDAGAKAEICEIDGGSHGFLGANARKADAAMLKFFGEYLRK